MRLIFISPFFWPEPISSGRYNSLLVKALSDFKCLDRLDVVCLHPFYPDWVSEKSPPWESAKISLHRPAHLIWFGKKKFVQRFVLELFFYYHVASQLLKLNVDQDCIVVNVVPPSLFCHVVNFLTKKIKKIVIVHDLQVGYLEKKGILGTGIGKIVKMIEKKGFREADRIICLSRVMAEAVEKQFEVDPRKITIKYPFSVLSYKKNPHWHRSFGRRDFDPKSTFVYSGGLGDKQDFKTVLDCFARKRLQDKNACFKIFSKGFVFEKLKTGNINLRIEFLNLIDERYLVDFFSQGFIFVVPIGRGVSDFSIPSKIFDLLACGSRILCICDEDSEMRRLLKDSTNSHLFTWEEFEGASLSDLLEISQNERVSNVICSPADVALEIISV